MAHYTLCKMSIARSVTYEIALDTVNGNNSGNGNGNGNGNGIGIDMR
jgi:hypothetical protein